MIIQKLINLSRNYIEIKINEAIITVPSYYNDSQRQAIIDSGKICGLNKLKIVNEDIAVCYAYGLYKYDKVYKKHEKNEEEEENDDDKNNDNIIGLDSDEEENDESIKEENNIDTKYYSEFEKKILKGRFIL